jgi:hypothetical protein
VGAPEDAAASSGPDFCVRLPRTACRSYADVEIWHVGPADDLSADLLAVDETATEDHDKVA